MHANASDWLFDRHKVKFAKTKRVDVVLTLAIHANGWVLAAQLVLGHKAFPPGAGTMRELLRYLRAVFRAWRLRLHLQLYAWQYRRGGVSKRLLAFDERQCSQHPTMERFRAAMVLAAIGDTVGFLNGRLEFARDLHRVHWTVRVLGGLEKMSLKPLVVSDDTVMHLATAKALSASLRSGYDCRWLPEACKTMALHYVHCMQDMQGRAPGGTTVANMSICEQFLDANPVMEFWRTPASRSKRGGGCG